LRLATDEAWELGVRGVPTATVDGSIFYGDDELEAAAIRAAAAKT
jgi:2-hydroxychromene-2-carboxylate isomerase